MWRVHTPGAKGGKAPYTAHADSRLAVQGSLGVQGAHQRGLGAVCVGSGR